MILECMPTHKHTPGNEHVDDRINDEHQEDIAQTEVIVQRYVLVEIVPLSSLPSDLQQSQSVDTQTHTRVGEDAKANLSTTVREVHIHVYTYMYCYCGHTDIV